MHTAQLQIRFDTFVSSGRNGISRKTLSPLPQNITREPKSLQGLCQKAGRRMPNVMEIVLTGSATILICGLRPTQDFFVI